MKYMLCCMHMRVPVCVSARPLARETDECRSCSPLLTDGHRRRPRGGRHPMDAPDLTTRDPRPSRVGQSCAPLEWRRSLREGGERGRKKAATIARRQHSTGPTATVRSCTWLILPLPTRATIICVSRRAHTVSSLSSSDGSSAGGDESLEADQSEHDRQHNQEDLPRTERQRRTENRQEVCQQTSCQLVVRCVPFVCACVLRIASHLIESSALRRLAGMPAPVEEVSWPLTSASEMQTSPSDSTDAARGMRASA